MIAPVSFSATTEWKPTVESKNAGKETENMGSTMQDRELEEKNGEVEQRRKNIKRPDC